MPDPRMPKEKLRTFDPKDINPCANCSNCCEYIAVNLDRPQTVKDFDEILWFLVHRDVWVYVDDENDWFVQFNTVCEKLGTDLRCGYYPNRPQLCRDYAPKDCVRYNEDEPEKFLFKNEMDLYRYMAKKRPKTYAKLKKKLDLPHKAKDLIGEFELVIP